METLSRVDIYADSKATVGDKKASRRRAEIKKLTQTGATVTYYDAQGNEVPPEPENGFPAVVAADEIHTKIARAPRAIARLDIQPETDTLTHSDSEGVTEA